MIKPPLLQFCSVIALAVAAPAYAGVVPSAGVPYSVQGIAEREITRRNDQVARAQQAIAEGDKAMEAKDYATAVQKYKFAADLLPESPVAHNLRSAAVDRYCAASIKLAEEQIAEGNFAQAEATAKAVLDPAYNPNYGPARTLLAHLEEPGYYNKTITPKFHAKVEQVKAWLVDAQGFFDSAQYSKAEMRYNQVLAVDRTNTAAREGLMLIDHARMQYAEKATDQTRTHRLWEVEKGWELPVPKYSVDKSKVLTSTQPSSNTAAIQNKLNTIIIPKVEFKDASVREAIDFLKAKSRELDIRETEPSRRGVNIVLQLDNPAGAPTTTPAADPNAPAIPGLDAAASGTTPAATTTTASNSTQTPITLSLNNVPMAEVLRYICSIAGLKVKIDPYAVAVVPLTAVVETLITKEYKVPPGTFTSSTGGGAAAAPAPAAAATASPGLASGNLGQRVTAKDYFTGLGVQFPPGSAANFIPTSSRLIVKNTQEQIDLIDTLVEALNGAVPSQVDIEAKFVEITQTNLKELSLDWSMGQVNLFNNARNIIAQGGDVLGTGTSTAITSSNRSGNNAISANAIDALLYPSSTASTASAPGTFSIGSSLTDPQFQVVLRAMNQKKGVDLLCSPRVTCKSGQEAEIEIIREFKYADEYTAPTISASGSGNSSALTVTPTTPSHFDIKPVGVRLHVQPTVGADGSTIDLQLEPQVVEFEGFVNYGSPIYGMSAISFVTAARSVLLTPNVINQPIFSTRKVRTSVSVWDGQTVTLGGLMREDVQKVEDKVPVLGDIPGVGRLFRSSVDQHQKKNLVIFVTARLINPAGDSINVSDDEKEETSDAGTPAVTGALPDTAPLLAPMPTK